MKTIIFCILILACSPAFGEKINVCERTNYSNRNCGHGKAVIQGDFLKTPSGDVFKIEEWQRSRTDGEIPTGSFSYNEFSKQLFVFAPGDVMPGVALRVIEIPTRRNIPRLVESKIVRREK